MEIPEQLSKEEVVETPSDVRTAEEPLPEFAEHPLADRIEELQLMADYPMELYENLKRRPIEFFMTGNMSNEMAKKYHPEICRRFIELEKRIKVIEDLLWNLPREERSLEEDRFEILTEVLDKAANGLEIWDDHVLKNIPMAKRLPLEAKLYELIDSKFKIIETTCAKFDELKGDQDGVNHEREWLRYEIRHCDMRFYELHEAFLLAYLEH